MNKWIMAGTAAAFTGAAASHTPPGTYTFYSFSLLQSRPAGCTAAAR